MTPGNAWILGLYASGMLKTRLTAWRVMSRDGFAFSVVWRIASSTVCSVQIRKMQTAIPAIVLNVRIQFRRRCFST